MRRVLRSLLPALLVVALGAGGTYYAIVSRKKPPRREEKREVPVVRVAVVRRQDVAVTITGYGTIRARDTVPVAPEVSGRIREILPELEVGRRVSAGTMLLTVDPEPYQLAKRAAEAEVRRLEARLEELRAAQKADRARLVVLTENRDLAQKEYKRLARLLSEQKVGSESEVEAARRAVLQAEELLLGVRKALDLSAIQIHQAEAALKAAQATCALAELDIKRTQVRAPVSGRLDQVRAEVGQVVQAGQTLVVIEADGAYEVPVPLEGKDLLYLPPWDRSGFFRDVPVTVTWLQGEVHWQGRLHRLQRYDPATRSAVVVASFSPRTAAADGTVKPQTGMFCSVRFQGKTAKGVFRIPRDLIGAEARVALEVAGRLEYRTVTVLKLQGSDALVSGGLRDGDRVILTPLPRAFSGMALRGVTQ